MLDKSVLADDDVNFTPFSWHERSAMTRVYLALLVMLLGHATCFAGKYNAVLDIGDPAPEWQNLPGVDGKQHSLSDLKDRDAVVVVFTCNSCPFAEDYEDRLIAFAKKHAGDDGRVAVVAINVNKIEADLPPAMKERAESKGFPFPYLFDETQQIARKFGATRTPEFFVLDKQRRVTYMGAMDDNDHEPSVTKNYLEAAIEATLRGEAVDPAETPPRGCGIRFERSRRR